MRTLPFAVMTTTSLRTLSTAIGIPLFVAGARAQHKATDTPVDFSASVTVTRGIGTAATTMKVHIDKYTDERDRTKLVDALKTNGYQAFLPQFRKLPIVGYIQIKEQKWDLRWAHNETTDKGQKVTVATDKPMFFLGGGTTAQPKARAGYELGVVQMDVDTIGMGSGTMAGAARVKPTPDMKGVTIDDYADVPTKLTSVSRIFS